MVWRSGQPFFVASPIDGGIKSWYKGKESHAVETRWSTKL
jgi:hypothetical protein